MKVFKICCREALYHPHRAVLSAHVQDCAIAILWSFNFGSRQSDGAQAQEGYVLDLTQVNAIDAGASGATTIELDIKMRVDAERPQSRPTLVDPVARGQRRQGADEIVRCKKENVAHLCAHQRAPCCRHLQQCAHYFMAAERPGIEKIAY